MADVDQATRYRRVKRLGAGGMATVTLAEDTVLGRLVALKRVHGGGDERGMLRLKREALVGASLNHPNLVFVYDAQLQEDGDVVIVMEYVEGETLADVIRTRGALAPPEAIRVLRGVATALDAIHERGIIHRDVKPANVLLGRDGTIKLADLGVADVADRTRITESGAMVGSFSYMAPEQLNGADPSPAMDVYALGAVAYEMLAGEKARPEGNPLALAHAISTQPPPDLRAAWPHAPAAAAAVLQRAMSADLGQRPASAGELVRRLEAAFEPERPTEDRRPAARPPAPAPRRPAPAPPATADPRASQRRRSALVPALLALVALAVAGVIVVWLSSSPGRTSAGQSSSTAAGTAHRSRATATTRSTRSTPATTAASHSTTSTPTTLHATSSAPATSHSTSSTPATSSSTPASSGSSAASSTPAGSSSTTPAGVVEQFYTAAAQHQYATAWALADPNLRNQLGGYAAFQNLMSSVRSITFQRASPLEGAASSTATVALSTTSVQTDRTERCAGTARTVRGGAGWLLDGISISCTPVS